MFSNFLYLLVALIVYSTAPLPEENGETVLQSVLLASLLACLFVGYSRFLFKRLQERIATDDRLYIADQYLNKYVSKLSVLALIVFTADLYIFDLKQCFAGVQLFQLIPTFEALIFIGLFLIYLIVVWNSAYSVQKKQLPISVSKKTYIVSNISFSLPALIPWFVLSLGADLLQLLPYQSVTSFLDTPQGEVVYVGLFLIPIAIFAPVFIKKIWRCRPLEQGEARTHIEELCDRAELNYADVLKWDLFGGSMITAGVMGLVGRFRYILVTPALINTLTRKEVDAVILHEIGHVKKKHMLLYLLFFGGYIACVYSLLDPILLLLYIAKPFYDFVQLLGMDKDAAMPFLTGGVMIFVFVFYFRYIFGFFMRNFERQADLHIYSFTNDATPLISTFYKIASHSRQSPDKPNWHHFSIAQRVNYLKSCQENPIKIRSHHKKVNKYLSIYFLVVVMVCFAGYSISYGQLKKPFELFVTKKLLLQQLDVDPENSDVYVMVADYYYSVEEFQKASDAYENVLKVDEINLHALNNLAWLLATCEDESIRDFERSLHLAQKALNIKREPHVLDTYAEASFHNGLYEEAVFASKEALEKTSEKKSYYKSQYERFEKKFKETADTEPQ